MDKFYTHEEQGSKTVIFIPDNWPIEDKDEYFMGYYYGYGATKTITNTAEIDTLWFDPALLVNEISEQEAKEIHPALFAHLEKINRGEI
jgi:hypothetical protein